MARQQKANSHKKIFFALHIRMLAGSRNNFNNGRIKKIREGFNKSRDTFLKPKIKEIRRNLYKIENKENPSKS